VGGINPFALVTELVGRTTNLVTEAVTMDLAGHLLLAD
jgi:hypothetical protein